MRHVGQKTEMYTEIWWGNLKERNHFENLGLNREKLLKWKMSL
jgi:hypothetical protein